MDKRIESISLRVPPSLKSDYDRLSPSAKTRTIKKMLEVVARSCWIELHYDPEFYFGEGFNSEDDI